MPSRTPVATRIACSAAVAAYLVVRPDSYAATRFAAPLVAFAAVAALGVLIDWVRLARPTFDQAFFAFAAWAGAVVVAFAPGPFTGLWHPVLAAVGLGLLLRRPITVGRIAEVDEERLTLQLGGGERVALDRRAHADLGAGSPWVLEAGAPLAVVAGLRRVAQGAGPFRAATVHVAGAVEAVAGDAVALRKTRRAHLRMALGLVALSAALGWGAVAIDATLGGPRCVL